MVDLVDRDGTDTPLCRPQQRPRGVGMVLWRQRRRRNRHRTCRRRGARLFGDVSASRMPSLVGAGAFSRSTTTRRGGLEEMQLQAALGVSLMYTRGNSEAGARGSEQKPGDRRRTWRRAHQVGLLGMLHMFHLRIGDFKATLHYARRSPRSPTPSSDPGGAWRSPIPFSGGRCITAAISRRPRRARGCAASTGRAQRGASDDLPRLRAYNYPRHRPRTDPVAARLSGAGDGTRAQQSVTRRRIEEPSGDAVASAGLGDLGVSLDRRPRDRRRTHGSPDLARRNPIRSALTSRSRRVTKVHWRFAGATPGPGLHAWKRRWRRSTPHATSC